MEEWSPEHLVDEWLARRLIADQCFEPGTLRLLGEAALKSDPLDTERAAQYFRDARALADELRMRPLVAHCDFGLARLSLRTGRRREAREAITAAVAMYRDMAMPFWLPEAEAVLRELA